MLGILLVKYPVDGKKSMVKRSGLTKLKVCEYT